MIFLKKQQKVLADLCESSWRHRRKTDVPERNVSLENKKSVALEAAVIKYIIYFSARRRVVVVSLLDGVGGEVEVGLP